MSLDSEVQIRSKIIEEINNWGDYYQIEFDDDQAVDLLEGIFRELYEGKAFDPRIPATLSHEDEHYNNTRWGN